MLIADGSMYRWLAQLSKLVENHHFCYSSSPKKVVPSFGVLNRYVKEEETLRSLHNCVVWVSGFWGAEKPGPLFWARSCSKSDGSLRVLRVERATGT